MEIKPLRFTGTQKEIAQKVMSEMKTQTTTRYSYSKKDYATLCEHITQMTNYLHDVRDYDAYPGATPDFKEANEIANLLVFGTMKVVSPNGKTTYELKEKHWKRMIALLDEIEEIYEFISMNMKNYPERCKELIDSFPFVPFHEIKSAKQTLFNKAKRSLILIEETWNYENLL